jgi:hypothetical protein
MLTIAIPSLVSILNRFQFCKPHIKLIQFGFSRQHTSKHVNRVKIMLRPPAQLQIVL